MLWLNKKSREDASDRLLELIETSPIAIARLNHLGQIVEFNSAFARLTNSSLSLESPLALTDIIKPEQRLSVENLWSDVQMRGVTSEDPLPLELNLPDGSVVMVSLFMSQLKQGADATPSTLIHLIDTTEQKNLEMRFAHSQKMQAVGQLAGGVAHDFNNLLTAMIGFCDLLLMRHPAGDPSFADIMQIKQNANRAANLVRQLLAFSRRQTLQPKVVDLTDVLAELSNLIRRLIGENIELKMVHGREIWPVKADQGQLEQVVINLAVNARDAMKKGGTLTIRSSNVTVDNEHPIDSDFVAPSQEESIAKGDYVLIEVTDSGHGIERSLMEKIFEPFFSTKEVGSGTGLGLATVYGIIKQTGGYVYVKSAIEQGTTFALFLPRVEGEVRVEAAEETTERNTASDLTGAATILLVEDETPVRIFAARALRNKGYEVLEADCGEQAIEVFSAHTGQIDVIISDVMMPGINGPTMIETLEDKYPDRMKQTQVIFISGYAEDAFVDTYGTEREFNFLPKPFTLKQLASKIKELT